MRARDAPSTIVGEFASKVLAARLLVYSDWVELEGVSEGRVRRGIVLLRDVKRARIEGAPSSTLVDLVIEGAEGRLLRVPMMDRRSAEEARTLVARLVSNETLLRD